MSEDRDQELRYLRDKVERLTKKCAEYNRAYSSLLEEIERLREAVK